MLYKVLFLTKLFNQKIKTMKNLLLCMLMLWHITTNANNNPDVDPVGTISGTVIDQKSKIPLPYVTIVVKDPTGKVLTGGITNESGVFEITDIALGKKMITIQYIGYKAYNSTIEISKKNRKVSLGKIGLEEDTTALNEVTVVAERSTIEQKVDRKVITIGKDLTTAAPTASEIMINLPSVNMDQQTGDISLRGNQNVRVMVDGKLTNVPVAQLLKQIPSTSIKQIELITNPSAKYNPEGMSGIINIVLHKNANQGFNGNVNFGYTYEINSKYNFGANMNYRKGKLNVYGNWGGNYSQNQNVGEIFRPDDLINQDFLFLEERNSNLIKVGVDFYLNEKHTLSVFTNQNIFDGSNRSTTGIMYARTPNLNQTQLFNNSIDNLSSQYNFDYKMDFEKEGHAIELEVDYNQFDKEEVAFFDFLGGDVIADYNDFVETDRTRTTINLDYENPLSDRTKLELGAEARLFESIIDYNSTGTTFTASGDVIPTPSTEFDYNRDVYSVYATFSQKFEKWSMQLGLRGELVEVQADTNAVGAFTNDYIQLYPTTFVTYNPSEKNQYQISYSRRVDRPGIGQVNPIREWSTPLISSFGNTQLEPQFTNSLELNYTRKLKKGNVTTGVFYRAINEEINRALFVDRIDLSKVILTHDNFDDTSAYGFEVSGNYKLMNWWSLNASFDVFSQKQKGISESLNTQGATPPTPADIVRTDIEVQNTAWNFKMNNNFKVTKKLTFNLFAFYRGANKGLQFDVEPMSFVNIGGRYNFAKDRATISVNYNDIFDTMKFAFEGTQPYAQDGEFNWESNTIFVGLSYRFGGTKYRAKSRKKRDGNEKSGGGVF